MPCYHPLRAWRSRKVNPSGKRGIVFQPSLGYRDLELDVPCGQCIGCKLEKSRQWAVRMVHEASLYDSNLFVTLTYDSKNLPLNNSVDYEAPVLFMKRLRERFGPGIRSYGCAEYGEDNWRPHYHLCLFNHAFPDAEMHRLRGEFMSYRSKILEELWPFGFSEFSNFSFETAAYVSRYVTKKLTGERASEYERYCNLDTGEIVGILPERAVCVSRRPGLGKTWFEKFKADIYPHDFVLVQRGERLVKSKPPRYYDYLLDKICMDDLADVKAGRRVGARRFASNNTFDRLRDREEIQYLKLEQYKRSFFDENF